MPTLTVNPTHVASHSLPVQELGTLIKASVATRDHERAKKKLRKFCMPFIRALGNSNQTATCIELFLIELPSGKFILASTTPTGGAAIIAGAIHCSCVFTKYSVGGYVRKPYTGWRMDPRFPGPAATYANLLKTGFKP